MQDEGLVLSSLAIRFSGKDEEREDEEDGGDLQDIEGGDLLSKKHDDLVKEEGVDMLNIDGGDLDTVSCDMLNNIESSDQDQQDGDLLNNEGGGDLLNLVLKWKERQELDGGSTQAIMQVLANSL